MVLKLLTCNCGRNCYRNFCKFTLKLFTLNWWLIYFVWYGIANV